MSEGLSDHDEDLIVECLSEGLGIEDISVIHGIPIDDVRAFVADLTASDCINEIYRKDQQ